MNAKNDNRRKVALVTGASSGIGKAIASRLAQEGIELWLTYFENEPEAQALATTLQSTVPCHVRQLDVRDEASCTNLLRVIHENSLRLDFLVNNASFWKADLWDKNPELISVNEIRNVIDVDLIGPFFLSTRAISYMKKSGKGAIVNISASGSVRGDSNTFAYNAAKVAVVGLSKSIARAFAPSIRCNVIAPGSIDTGWVERWKLSEEEIENLDSVKQMAGRIGRPEEVASLTWFLLSDEADYINGQLIFIDGGISA